MAEVVKLNGITKYYHTVNGETEALKDISFSVKENEFVSLIGPSGCGKSTVLSIISGLEAPSGGRIDFQAKKSKIGYMLQQDHLFPWLKIKDNVLLGLEIQHRKTDENIERTYDLLKQYGLWEFRNSYPNQLSGGMRQRAALIRTLAVDPSLLLLDEPFSALDYQTRLSVSDDIYSIIKSQGKTAILVTHDISEAISMSDKVIVLTKRPATVKKIHSIKLSDSGSPISRRNAVEFPEYFKILWKELNNDE